MYRLVMGKSLPNSPDSSPILSFSSLYTPSLPSSFSPQHLAEPSSKMAQVCSSPATTEMDLDVCRKAVCREAPISSDESTSPFVPIPIWPTELSPQHATLRLSSSMQVWE